MEIMGLGVESTGNGDGRKSVESMKSLSQAQVMEWKIVLEKKISNSSMFAMSSFVVAICFAIGYVWLSLSYLFFTVAIIAGFMGFFFLGMEHGYRRALGFWLWFEGELSDREVI